MRRPLLPALCALALFPGTAQAIVGGGPAPDGEFPFTAKIDIAGAAGCTGSLVAPTWVVTAGHCASATGVTGVPLAMPLPPSSFAVTVGTTRADGEGGQTRGVKAVRVDPNYAATNGTGSDVALLELAQAVTVAPVKIAAPSEAGLWEPGDALTIAGFGVTEENGDAPDRLQFTAVPRVADPVCAEAYSDGTPVAGNAFDPRTALCAGQPEGGKDTCQGDSGGPILAPLDKGYRLVGATSYGEGCAREGKPGVYARLAEGSVKAFVSNYVPDAYAKPASGPGGTPSTPPNPSGGGQASCAGRPGLRIRVRRGRATLFVAGTRIARRRAPVTFRLAKRLPAQGTAKVRVVVRRPGLKKRTIRRTYTDCARTA